MRPTPDVDVVILIATALAAKRRPAELVEIVAAADLLLGFVPYADKLGDALARLSARGLISASEAGFTLTPAAEAIIADQPKKADNEQRIAAVTEQLAGYAGKGEHTAIVLSREQLNAALQAHKASRNAPGKNLLMPKPKADRHFKVEGRWRRAPASQGRKS